tara:strand:- start:120 stop:620 length:501 start_codon:yes stop_codon:yes gene_type:complete
MEMLNVYNLFSVPVIHGKLPLDIYLHKKILKYVDENFEIKERFQSCVNGFQTHENFDGKEELNNTLDIFFKNNFNFKIIDSGWLNVLENKSYNLPHNHLDKAIAKAGVFYLTNNNNNITFTRGSEIFEIRPKIFEYLIFPHDLIHYVLAEDRLEKRISYSFNLKDV